MDGKEANRMLMDEIGQMPFTIKMNGCKFRLDMLKMAYSNQPSYPKPTVDSLIKDAEKLIDWVNNEIKFQPITSKKND